MSTATALTSARERRDGVADLVARGLGASRKSLSPQLFYDARGSELFERITELPEYYLTRAERAIFEQQSDAIVAAVRARTSGKLTVLELGAGTATKSQVLLRAVVRQQGPTVFVPCDVSATALEVAARRFADEERGIVLRPRVGTHFEVLAWARELPGPLLVMFIGSSIGNYEMDEATQLLTRIQRTLSDTGVLLLGADVRKSPDILIPAYDDAEGVTAAFNLNVLARINRELGADFALDRFRHVALWNDAASRVEMHLESTVDQLVCIRGLGMTVHFGANERIHTESSHKYDTPRMESMLAGAGLARASSFGDDAGRFTVHLAHTQSVGVDA